MLRVVAAAIRTSLRGTDIVARVGGDEFAIVAPGLAETRALDARVEEAVRRATAAAGHEVGVSIGWCPIDPQDRRPILELVDEADRVMYALRHRRRATAAELPEHALEVARVA